MKRIQAFVQLLLRQLKTVSKKIVLPGFKGQTLFDVIYFFVKSVKKEGIKLRSSSMAFSFFLAIFPSLLFLLTLISYLPISGLKEESLMLLKGLLPSNAYEVVNATITDILVNQNPGLLSLGGLMFLYFSSNGIMSMIKAFNKRFERQKQFFLKNRLKSIGITLFLSIQTILGICLFVISESFIKRFESTILGFNAQYYLLVISKFVLIFLLIIATISALYHLCTNFPTKYRLLTPGAILATLLCLGTSYIFSYYVDNFGSYNKVYGSLGTIIALMMLIYINSTSILIGYELNASILDAKQAKSNNDRKASRASVQV